MGEDKSEVNKEDDKGHNEANDEEEDDNEKDDDEGDDEDDDEDDDNKDKDKEEDKRWSSFYLRRSTCSMEETDSRIVSPFVSGGFSNLLEHTRSVETRRRFCRARHVY